MAGNGNPSGGKRRPAADGEGAFRGHLTVYLVFALFFFSLNLLTDPGNWWFYWPLFFWGWALVFHAVATYGAAAPARVVALLRAMLPGGAPARAPVPPTPGVRVQRAGSVDPRPAPEPSSAEIADEAEARVARLWRTARQIPAPAAREQAFRVAAAADRVAEVMAEDKTDAETVRWFIDRYLTPTEGVLERYARLSQRGLEAAAPTLARVEERDLPLLETRLNDLYEQIHRGDVIDLAVASEMLEFDDAGDRPPRSSRP